MAATGYTGSDSFAFTVTDGEHIETSMRPSVSLTISAVPVGNPDLYSLPASGTLTVSASQGVLANDFSPTGDSLSAVLSSPPSVGTLVLNADGSFTYTPPTTPLTTAVTFMYQPVVSGTTNIGNVTTVTLEAGSVSVTNVLFSDALPVLNDVTSVPFLRGWTSTKPNASNPLVMLSSDPFIADKDHVSALFTITTGSLPQFTPYRSRGYSSQIIIKGTAVAVGNQLIFTGDFLAPLDMQVLTGLAFTWTISLPGILQAQVLTLG